MNMATTGLYSLHGFTRRAGALLDKLFRSNNSRGNAKTEAVTVTVMAIATSKNRIEGHATRQHAKCPAAPEFSPWPGGHAPVAKGRIVFPYNQLLVGSVEDLLGFLTEG